MNQQKQALVQLGEFTKHILSVNKWPGYVCGAGQNEWDEFKNVINRASIANPWFSKEMINNALAAWAENLNKKNIDNWLNRYKSIQLTECKTVFLICAGNLPMVGLHDILCCYLLGCKVQIKLSKDDALMIPALLNVLSFFDSETQHNFQIITQKPTGYDIVIATGNNNSNRYFEHYFGNCPHLFRKNRTSVAVIDGDITEQQLQNLSKDIFQYYGLGCRSVTKLYLPYGFNKDRLFKAFYDYKEVINHNKYMNNYEYNKAIFLLQKVEFLDNGFLLLKEDSNLFSPIGVLHYECYNDLEKLNNKLKGFSEDIQCRVGTGGIPFGSAQKPKLWDYADGVDTLEFLSSK